MAVKRPLALRPLNIVGVRFIETRARVDGGAIGAEHCRGIDIDPMIPQWASVLRWLLEGAAGSRPANPFTHLRPSVLQPLGSGVAQYAAKRSAGRAPARPAHRMKPRSRRNSTTSSADCSG